MKDFLGNKIKLGDRVIFTNQHYRSLEIGLIVDITEKTVLIERALDNPNYTPRTFRQQSHQIFLLND